MYYSFIINLKLSYSSFFKFKKMKQYFVIYGVLHYRLMYIFLIKFALSSSSSLFLYIERSIFFNISNINIYNKILFKISSPKFKQKDV